MILLAYEKSLKKESKVVLTDNDQTILHTYIVPDNALCLYKDFGGRVFVIGTNKVFFVDVDSKTFNIDVEVLCECINWLTYNKHVFLTNGFLIFKI